MTYDNIIKCSGGNDSVALIQWAHEHGLKNVIVMHNDTGWSREDCPARIESIVKPLAKRYGFAWQTLESVGMERCVKGHSGWPSNFHQFCTVELKLEPYKAWLRQNWPKVNEAIAYVGVRRCESAKRANWPEYKESSYYDLGLPLHSPLVLHTDEMRNDLLARAGVAVLSHRSRECCPCVNSNKSDLLALSERDIAKVERIEKVLGYSKNGKLRSMFRAKKHQGAWGIRNIIKWAKGEEFVNDELDIPLLCDAGLCGD